MRFGTEFWQRKQCVLVLNFGKEKQRAFVSRFVTELWHRKVIHLYDKRPDHYQIFAQSKAVCFVPNFSREKQCLYRFLSKGKRRVFVPNIGKEKQCVLH